MRHARAPDGTTWEVDRIWLERPGWSRARGDDLDPFDAGAFPVGFGGVGDDALSVLASTVVVVLVARVPQLLGIRGGFWGWFWLEHAVRGSGRVGMCGH
jgi:hypothetical protein